MEYKNKIIFSIDNKERQALVHEIEAVKKILNADLILSSNKDTVNNVSFIVDVDKRQDVEVMANTFGQDSILILKTDKVERYHLKTGLTEAIGLSLNKVDKKPTDKDFFINKNDFYVIV